MAALLENAEGRIWHQVMHPFTVGEWQDAVVTAPDERLGDTHFTCFLEVIGMVF